MKRETLRLALAAFMASAAWGVGIPAQGQFSLGETYDPAAGGTVIVALRPQVPSTPQQQPQVAPPGAPGTPGTAGGVQAPGNAAADGTAKDGTAKDGSVKDGTGKDDKVKTAQDPNAPSGDSGRLSPITMESVRAPIGAADISVDDIGTRVLPEDQASKQQPAVISLPGGQDRAFGCLTYRWQATNLCHWPLYFEEPMLERHGQQCSYPALQPAISGSKFLGNLIMYPYKATLQPALESRYALGHFRPGSSAPLLRDTLPWSPRAALVQGAAVTAVGVGLPW